MNAKRTFTKDLFLKWLNDSDMEPKEIEVPDGSNAKWVIRAVFGGFPFTILYPIGSEYVQLLRVAAIEESTIEALSILSKTTRLKFLHAIKRGFLTSHIRYQLEFKDEDKTILSMVKFNDRIFFNGISEDLFVQRILTGHDCSILIIAELKYYMDEMV